MSTTHLSQESRARIAPRLSVVVPAYNEGSGIASNLERLYDHLDTTLPPNTWELIVVDDGSRDETLANVERFAKGLDNVCLVAHKVNQGVGAAMKSGIDRAQGSCIVTLDSDLSYEPGVVNRLSEALQRSNASLVLASPYMAGGGTRNVPATRLFMSTWANRLLSFASGAGIKTFTGMVRAYDRAFLSTIAWPRSGNVNVGVLLAARRSRAVVLEIPAELAWPANRGVPRLSYRRAAREVLSVLRYSIDFARARIQR